MVPTEMVAWIGGAIGLAGVAWAFFKSDSLAVRLGALGAFGVFYIGMLVVGWGDINWFNANTFGVVAIAILSRMKSPLAPSRPTTDSEADGPSEATPDADPESAPAADDQPEAKPSE